MKKNEKIRTPLGIISVFKNEIPERYHCAAEPEILRISETHIRIRTIDQVVSWGEEVYSPRLHQNCMNPENITLYPLEIEWNGDKDYGFRSLWDEKVDNRGKVTGNSRLESKTEKIKM